MRSAGSNSKTGNTVKRTGTTQDKGTTHTPTTPAIQQGHRVNDKGDTNTQTGSPATQPPFTHHATHHPLCHPTIHDGPTHHHCEGGADRGYPTTRTPQTHVHHPHTAAPGKEQCTT